MKLLYCPNCNDVFSLSNEEKICTCGQCFGWYEDDGLNATISYCAIPLGFHNSSFLNALEK